MIRMTEFSVKNKIVWPLYGARPTTSSRSTPFVALFQENKLPFFFCCSHWRRFMANCRPSKLFANCSPLTWLLMRWGGGGRVIYAWHYIIQSKTPACILTDSKPCTQTFESLRRPLSRWVFLKQSYCHFPLDSSTSIFESYARKWCFLNELVFQPERKVVAVGLPW